MDHKPVLIKEVIEYLAPKSNENYIDATVGFGGHAAAILKKTGPKGKLLGIDRDQVALEKARHNLLRFDRRVNLTNANFTEIGLIIRQFPQKINGILFDLGTSNYQLLNPERGFSFAGCAPLDMRMDRKKDRLTAADIVNKYSQKEITEILQIGEERFARPIAQKIVIERAKKPIETTAQLVEIIQHALPPSYRHQLRTHFATDTFRALRLKVNHELNDLESVLKQSRQILSVGGRCAVVSFHSLEDRIVKNFFKDEETWEIVTKKPVMASNEEIAENPRSRSAKLRVAIRK